MNGILLINKEKDYTSRDVVNIVSKKLKTKKVGHTGTLDPMATGVLVLCIGKATKLVEIITNEDKEYIAEITLGILTDTLDITGNILKEENVSKTDEEILNVLNSLIGSYEQEVPIYSAIKIDGKKLYEYARNKEDINLPKRLVTIKNLELINEIKRIDNKIIFNIKCLVSKGTYIRSLVRDIALKLNTVGTMSNLTRTKQGIFNLDDCYNLKEIETDQFKLLNPINSLNKYKQIIVNNELLIKIKNGQLLLNNYNIDIVIFKTKDEQLIAIYKQYEKDNKYLKPWKMLF